MSNLIIHGITAFIIAFGGAAMAANTAGELTPLVWVMAGIAGLMAGAKDIQSRLAKPPK